MALFQITNNAQQSDSNYAKEAVEEAVKVEFEGVRTKVMTPEHLIALFVKASREKDKTKIKLLLDQGKIDRKKLSSILMCYGLDEKFKNKDS